MNNQVWIVDFGSQYTQLITRKIRELQISSCILTVEQTRKKLVEGHLPKAIILSGGPNSIFEDQEDYSFIFKNSNIPILGICYGMQILAHYLGGKVERGNIGEYGHSQVQATKQVFQDCPMNFKVWMSHSDHVTKLPNNFEVILTSDNGLTAAILAKDKPMMGLQFHPEVEHTENGKTILSFFLKNVAGLKEDWHREEMFNEALNVIKKVNGSKVLCAFSGGVDSLVAATLAAKTLGKDLFCFFVDHGLLRKQDLIHIATLKNETDLQIEVINAQGEFLSKLEGVDEPEAKRKIIGQTFIEVFERKVHEFEKVHGIKFEYLLQGTLYPDVIESVSPHQKGGKSVTIKSHHNVGGLPEKMNLKLLEPLRFLFKDEVRKVGEILKLKKSWIYRHPFPGPGIGIRVLGQLSSERINKVRESDQVLFEELNKSNLYDQVWQAFTVLLPVKTVGVKGDSRAYEEVICLRLVNSSDGMTASWSQVPFDFLQQVSSRITNEVKGVTRVVYDITSKPPGTIEWE